jgi:ubiquinone/menaquinone biosynthesis C-methylase UbiE
MVHKLADAYDRYIGRYSRQLARQFIAVVGIGGDQRVLDVGCGPGSLTTALVEVLGAERVCAVDPSDAYVEACRASAPGADVRVGRAEGLPFADGEFDVVLAQLVLNLLEHPEAAVREMARVAKPAGIVAAAVWAQDGMPLLRLFWDAAAAVAPDAVAAVGESGRVGLRYEQLAALWQRGGLTSVSLAELEAAVTYEDFDDLWAPIEAGVGKSGELCLSLEATRRRVLRSEMHHRLGAPAGSFRLTARSWCVQGTAT